MKRPMLFLGHGAAGDARSMAPWVRQLAALGVAAEAVTLPKSNAQRAQEVFRTALVADPSAAIGGHSYGGRMASLVAADQPVSALILLSYPLHRPGHPEELRTEHWPRIGCPVLLLSGDRDQFAQIALLQREVSKLRDHELVIYPGQRHGLLPVAGDAAARIAAFLEARAPAATHA